MVLDLTHFGGYELLVYDGATFFWDLNDFKIGIYVAHESWEAFDPSAAIHSAAISSRYLWSREKISGVDW